MWKHKNFINLQLYAPGPHSLTVYFDSNIISVTCTGDYGDSDTWTESGTTMTITSGKTDVQYFTVLLKEGYVLDSITHTEDSLLQLNDVTDNSFNISGDCGGLAELTLTSKSAAFDGKINVTKSAGVVLKTQGKYCAEDITVVPTLEEKSVTPTESAQEIVPSDGNCGISKVNVGAVQTETKTITPTTSQQTFTPPSGKYFKQVICQAIQAYQGTATPTKSEQIINPTSNKYFSSFKVAPIPSDYVKPSGTLQITANGTKDVTNYKNVNVNVEPNLEQKTVTITQNGTTEITPTTGKDGMSKVTVTTNVPTASAVEEVATASAMDALLVEANVGKYYKFTGTTDSNYTNGDLYLVEGGASGETWVLNEYATFDDGTYVVCENTPFTSNQTKFASISMKLGQSGYEDGLYYDSEYVFYGEVREWVNPAFRTLTFDSPVTDTTLLEWLQANGTKQ